MTSSFAVGGRGGPGWDLGVRLGLMGPEVVMDYPPVATLVTPFAHHGAMSYVQPVFN